MAGTLPELEDSGKVETEFFDSLVNFEKMYSIEIPNFRNLVYPLNIFRSYQSASARLTLIDRSLELLVLQNERHFASLATVKTFNTGQTLYYLPVEPLYDLLNDNTKMQQAQLLLSACTYLYQIVGVSYYRETDSYLYYMYDMIESWMLEDEERDEEEAEEILDHASTIAGAGDFVLEHLKSKHHLELFEKRLHSFIPSSVAEVSLQAVSAKLYSLFEDYPERSFNRGIEPDLYEQEEEDADEIVRTENYLSFFWNYNDCMYDQLMEYINCELNEYSKTEEPVTIQYFSDPQGQSSHNHDFNIRLMEILHELTDCLSALHVENHKSI